MLNQQQFPGFEAVPTVAPERTEMRLIQRYENDFKPVGMRGSIPERKALRERRARGKVVHDQWDSVRTRVEDSNSSGWDDFADYPREAHSRTGLPESGEISTHDDIGMQMPLGNVPDWATFHGSSMSGWAKHGQIKEVPLPTLQTRQHEVSATRVHQLIDDPNTRDSRTARGLAEELPRVYRNAMGDDMLVDGNHRVSADLLQGQMFGRARVLTAMEGPSMDSHNARIARHQESAQRGLAIRGMEEFHEGRVNDLVYGEGNW